MSFCRGSCGFFPSVRGYIYVPRERTGIIRRGYQMILLTAVVGLIQLIVAVILAAVALYIGFSVFGRITGDIDEQQELAKGNVAFGIVVAAIFVAIAVVVQSGITGIAVGVSKASADRADVRGRADDNRYRDHPAGAGCHPCHRSNLSRPDRP